jgi:hypothetical protein
VQRRLSKSGHTATETGKRQPLSPQRLPLVQCFPENVTHGLVCDTVDLPKRVQIFASLTARTVQKDERAENTPEVPAPDATSRKCIAHLKCSMVLVTKGSVQLLSFLLTETGQKRGIRGAASSRRDGHRSPSDCSTVLPADPPSIVCLDELTL